MNARRQAWGYRANVAARVAAATGGGYALIALTAYAAARALPADRLQASVAATILALVLMPVVVIWAFMARTPLRAWVGLAGIAALLAAFAFGVHPRP